MFPVLLAGAYHRPNYFIWDSAKRSNNTQWPPNIMYGHGGVGHYRMPLRGAPVSRGIEVWSFHLILGIGQVRCPSLIRVTNAISHVPASPVPAYLS